MTLADKLLINNLNNAIHLTSPYYDDAIVGYTDDDRIIYDYNALVDVLIRDGALKNDAIEWIDYNIIGTIQSDNDKAPIIMYKLEE